MGALEWALLILLSILWGGSFFFAEVALEGMQPFTIVFFRVSLAAATLIGIVYATGQTMPGDLRLWLAFFVMGLANNIVPFSLITWGQTQITGGLASILNATTPLFAVFLAHFFTRDERLTLNRLAGVAIGLFGVVVMIGTDVLAGIGLNVLAQIAVLGAALAYGISGVYGRRFASLSPIVPAAGMLTASSVMMLPVMLVVDQPWAAPLPGLTVWSAVIGMAVVSTAAAYLIYFRILASAGATNILLVTLLVPVSAILLGVFILGERLELQHLIGMALITAGLAAIDGRPLRLVRRRRRGGSPAPTEP